MASPDTAGVKARAWKTITDQWRPPVTTPELNADVRSRNEQRIDALRDQVSAYREDTADEYAHDREQAIEEVYRYDDDQQLGEDTDFHSGLGY
jgi:hypothetical protein